MKYKQSVTSLVSLGNAAELVNAIAKKVVGTEVADTLSGSPISDEMIMNLAASSIEKVLVAKTEA